MCNITIKFLSKRVNIFENRIQEGNVQIFDVTWRKLALPTKCLPWSKALFSMDGWTNSQRASKTIPKELHHELTSARVCRADNKLGQSPEDTGPNSEKGGYNSGGRARGSRGRSERRGAGGWMRSRGWHSEREMPPRSRLMYPGRLQDTGRGMAQRHKPKDTWISGGSWIWITIRVNDCRLTRLPFKGRSTLLSPLIALLDLIPLSLGARGATCQDSLHHAGWARAGREDAFWLATMIFHRLNHWKYQI